MEDNPSIETSEYIENPDVLVELCESVLDELLSSINDTELKEKQAQLIEISRSIDKLSKQMIGIPDEFRNLKINLMTEIETLTQTKGKIEKIITGLKEMLKRIDTTYFADSPTKKRIRKRKSISNLPQTRKIVFRPEIINALKSLGGSGTNLEVIDIIEERMKGKLLPGDFEKRAQGVLVWKNNVHWERNSMKEEGILCSDSPRGTWELNEEYK